MRSKLDDGKVPSPPQLAEFLRAVVAELRPLAAAEPAETQAEIQVTASILPPQ